MTEDGDASLVWKWTNEALDTTTYAASANGTAITNLFDESDPNKSSNAPGSVTWMSRSDWTGTVPTQPAALTANETLAADLPLPSTTAPRPTASRCPLWVPRTA